MIAGLVSTTLAMAYFLEFGLAVTVFAFDTSPVPVMLEALLANDWRRDLFVESPVSFAFVAMIETLGHWCNRRSYRPGGKAREALQQIKNNLRLVPSKFGYTLAIVNALWRVDSFPCPIPSMH